MKGPKMDSQGYTVRQMGLLIFRNAQHWQVQLRSRMEEQHGI